MLTLVPALSLSAAMVASAPVAGNALLSGRASGRVGPPAVASVASWYDAGERLRSAWPARGGTGGYHRMAGRTNPPTMAGADVLVAEAMVSIADDAMFLDEAKALPCVDTCPTPQPCRTS